MFSKLFCKTTEGYLIVTLRGISVWDPSNHGNVVVYAVQALIIKMDTFTKNQHIFVGHTSPVTSLAFNKQQSEREITYFDLPKFNSLHVTSFS